MKLEDFLKIKDEKILLPISEFEFILSRESAENMVVALRGALKRLKKQYPAPRAEVRAKNAHTRKREK